MYYYMSPKEFGEFMRKLRGKMTLRTAAEKSGLSYTYISFIEKGYRPGTQKPIKVTPESLQKLAQAYDHSYEDLLMKAGYITSQMALNLEGAEDGDILRYHTIEESKSLYETDKMIVDNDLQKILLNNNFVSYRGVILSMDEKLQIIDMLPVLFKNK